VVAAAVHLWVGRDYPLQHADAVGECAGCSITYIIAVRSRHFTITYRSSWQIFRSMIAPHAAAARICRLPVVWLAGCQLPARSLASFNSSLLTLLANRSSVL
jgi:hypothetical protein